MIDFRRALPGGTSLGRFLRFPLKLIPSKAVVPILSGPMKGLKWVAGAGNHGCWLGTYELATQQRIVKEIGACDVAFDLGANHGFFTMLLSQSSKSVVAVEPICPEYLSPGATLGDQRHHELRNSARRGGTGKRRGIFRARRKSRDRKNLPGGSDRGEHRLTRRTGEEIRPSLIYQDGRRGSGVGVLTGGAGFLKEYRPKLFVLHARQ